MCEFIVKPQFYKFQLSNFQADSLLNNFYNFNFQISKQFLPNTLILT